MIRQSFTEGWYYGLSGEEKKLVVLPHDAQLHQKRRQDAEGGSGHGYFPGGVYEYEKVFYVPQELENTCIYLEFEGIYKNSRICINGIEAAFHPYGYTSFAVELSSFLHFGAENKITVTADNSKLPNSRWYSGGGIYRPVWIYIGESSCIDYQGIRVTTLALDPPIIQVHTKLKGTETAAGEVSVFVQILDGEELIAEGNGNSCSLVLDGAEKWSAENPKLYTCRVSLLEADEVIDQAETDFGIRMLFWSTDGFFVNGEKVLLRGGCIHHDNGLLGAAAFDKSEARRVRILKENGFNAIRCAHNPASRALLDACDRLGMYVMDETFDTWYNRKNPYDYGLDFEACWKEDVTSMVLRDYNHPSVVLYSIGNEIGEPAEEKGLETASEMIDLIHELDSTRPVTCGVNFMILSRAAKGKGLYKDGEQIIPEAKPEKAGSNSSLAFNMMAGMIGQGMNKMANSRKVDAVTAPFADMLDIVGYNYASGRYPLEAKEHPDRIFLGSETFPQDIADNWAMTGQIPALLGDFMWTAWDYLGEAGLGAWSYQGGMSFNRPYPWLLAGAGVIDILGIPDASCRYAGVVWDQLDRPVIGVRPVNHPGVRPSKSVWRGTNAVESWSWMNCSGNEAMVEVYGRGEKAELFLNGRSLGIKELKKYKAQYRLHYTPGILSVKIYDQAGEVCGTHELISADGERKLRLVPEEKTVQAGEIVYVNLEVAGENGICESNGDTRVKIYVEGGLLLGFGSADPRSTDPYVGSICSTYMGRAQAVILAEKEGVLRVGVKSRDYPPVQTAVYVQPRPEEA